MHQSFSDQITFLITMLIFLDFRAQKFPLIFFNVNPFKHQHALNFGVLNYEKQHKERAGKVSERYVVFSAFYADFCLCSKLVIITTLTKYNFENQNNVLFQARKFCPSCDRSLIG